MALVMLVLVALVPGILAPASWARGPVFTSGGGVAAPGTTPSYTIGADGTATFSSVQAHTLRGDISGTTVTPVLPQAVSRTLAARTADMQFAGDFGITGGGAPSAILQAQAAGDTTALLPGGAPIVVGRLLTAAALPVGTRILSVTSPSSVSQTRVTSAATATRSSSAMGTALVFPGLFAIPPGATVGATGVDPAATVVKSVPANNGTTVYISAPVTAAVPAGTSVQFAYATASVGLSAAWTQAAPAATPVGLPLLDEAQAFQNATFFANVSRGGSGLLYIPGGNYYSSVASAGSDGVSVETAANVVLLPGSQPIGGLRGYSASTAGKTLASSAQNNLPSGLNIDQTVFQQTVPTDQTQALLVSQHNINCIDDGGPLGCGMVGSEIQQDVEPSIAAGIMWGYHLTDYIYPNQTGVSWVGAELEVNDNSGTDKPQPGGSVVSYGTHLDLLGSTNGTAGIYFGASGSGRWHYGMACPQNAIINDCWSVHAGIASTVIAGVDMNGNLMAQTVRAAGSIVSAQSAAYSIAPGDCGTTIRDTGTGAHAYTVPSGLPVGCRLDIIQAGSAAVTFTAGSGETLEAYNSATHTSGIYAKAQILVDSGTSFLLSGQVQ